MIDSIQKPKKHILVKILETGEKDSLKEILKSKGFGYVCFDNPESAKNAMLSFNGKYLPSFD